MSGFPLFYEFKIAGEDQKQRRAVVVALWSVADLDGNNFPRFDQQVFGAEYF